MLPNPDPPDAATANGLIANSSTVIHAAANAFVLYQRDDCHLCDLALAALAEAACPAFESVFIDDDDRLEARYGHRVPVLAGPRPPELEWPFGAEAVRAWLALQTLSSG